MLFDETINDVIPVIDETLEKEWEEEKLPFVRKLFPDKYKGKAGKDIRLVRVRVCDYGKLYEFPDGIQKAEYHEEEWELQIGTASGNNQRHTFTNEYSLEDVWKRFERDIKIYCELSNEDIEYAHTYVMSQDLGKPLYISAISYYCEDKARRIFNEGSIYEFIIYCCNKRHHGNTHIVKAMLLSYANTKVINSNANINLGIFSNAHAGKTHIKDTVKLCLPDKTIEDSSKSDKALFYDNTLQSGTIIVQDDQTLTEELQNIFKNLKPDQPHTHKTVKNQENLTTMIPQNCPYWLIKVESQGDDQIQDRQLNLRCDDETPEYQKARRDKQNEMWGENGNTVSSFTIDAKTCQAIWNYLQPSEVEIPFRDCIIGNSDQPRLYNMFMQAICAAALLHCTQRKHNEYGRIIATIDDFKTAADVINPLLSNEKGSQKLGLTKDQMIIGKAFEYLGRSGIYSTNQIIAAINDIGEGIMTKERFSRAMNGRPDRNVKGFVDIFSLDEVTTNTSIHDEDNERTDATRVSRKAYQFNYEHYKRIMTSYEPFTISPFAS